MIKKALISIIVLFVIIVASGLTYDYYQKIEDKKMWDKYYSEYEAYWNNGSNHSCKLTKADSYIVTESNEDKFLYPKLSFKLEDNILYLKAIDNGKIAQMRLVTNVRDSDLFNATYQMGKEKIHLFKNHNMELRIWNKKTDLYNVYQYECMKQN